MCQFYPVIYYTVQVGFSAGYQSSWDYLSILLRENPLMSDFNFRLNTPAGRLPLLPDCGHPQPCGHALSSNKCRKSENKLLVTAFSMLYLQTHHMALLADLHQQQGGVRTNFSSEQYSLAGGLLGEIEYWILSDIKLYQENNNNNLLCDLFTEELHISKTSHNHRHCRSLACCQRSLAKTDVLGEDFFHYSIDSIADSVFVKIG